MSNTIWLEGNSTLSNRKDEADFARRLLALISEPEFNMFENILSEPNIKYLRDRHQGIKMAVTNEEKRLALALYENYSDVFDAIFDVLVSEGTIDYSTSDVVENTGRASGRLAVRINQQVLSNETVRLLFKDVLVYIVDLQHVLKTPLPWGVSSRRFILTNEDPPIHPNGRGFFYPEAYKGYTVETHYARDRAMKVLSDLCARLELEFEVIDV